VRRFGTEAQLVVDNALARGLSLEESLAPAGPTIPATLAELLFGVTHEGAHDVDDLLDRRTRIGLVPTDRALAEPLARRALELAAR
jgi:glycerol-3-phosphate dehydrogenase